MYSDILFFFLQRLKNIFHRLTIYLSKDLEDHAKLKRYIIAYPLKYPFCVKIELGKRVQWCIVDSVRSITFHLSPGLYAAAKIAIFLVLWKIASLTIFRVSCDFSQFFVMVIIAEIAKITVFAGHLLYLLYHLNLGFTMFWIRTQLDFSGLNPNSNQPRIVNQCFLRELFEERNSRLKSGERNAKCPTRSNPWYSYNGKSVFGFAVSNGD